MCWLLGLSVRELASFLVETGEMRVQSRRFLLNFFSGDTPFFTLEAQIKETLEEAEALARDDQLDQGDGSEQSAMGSGAYSG